MAKSLSASFILKMVSKNKLICEEEATFVLVPALDGEVGVLAHHAPFLSPLRKGRLDVVKKNNDKVSFNIEQGFVFVKNNILHILLT